MFRVQELAKSIARATKWRVTSDSVLSSLAIRAKGKLFIRPVVGNPQYHRFDLPNDVIIPPDLATRFIRQQYLKENISDAAKVNIGKDEALKILAKQPQPVIHFPDDLNTWQVPELSVAKVPTGVLLGHFDHGKTSLLDCMLDTPEDTARIVDTEMHGITQEVRSRLVNIDSRNLTLLDTPGQEIFYGMRNHGAQVADFGLLVVAANEGFCQQTAESIGIIERLKIPVVVCINKIDLAGETEEERNTRFETLVAEGRDYIALQDATFVPISAKYGFGIEQLRGMISTMLDDVLKKNTVSGRGRGRGRGRRQAANALFRTEIKLEREGRGQGLNGRGFVIDISTNLSHGRLLHVVTTHGKVAVGDYFSSGGWAGRVAGIITHSGAGIASNQQSLIAGQGGMLRIHTLPGINNPRPLGESIHFFSPEILLKNPDNATKKQRDRASELARASAELEADVARMDFEFDAARVTPEEADKLRLDHEFAIVKRSSIYHGETMLETEDHDTVHDENLEADTDEEDEEEEEEDDGVEPQLYIVKASSEMEISTVMDAFEDFSHDRPAGRIVYSGVGVVTQHDVRLAQSANASILCFNVGIEKIAHTAIANTGVPVVEHTKIRELVEQVLGKSIRD